MRRDFGLLREVLSLFTVLIFFNDRSKYRQRLRLWKWRKLITKELSLNFIKYYIFEFKQQVNMKSNQTFFELLSDLIIFVFFANGFYIKSIHRAFFFLTHEDVNCFLCVLLPIFAWRIQIQPVKRLLKHPTSFYSSYSSTW